MQQIGELIKNRVNRILPKILMEKEKELGYSLPKVKIIDIGAYSSGRFVDNKYDIYLSSIFVDAKISIKNATLGKVKKIVVDTIENVVKASGFEHEEIYVQYETADNSEFINENTKDKVLEKYLEIIKEALIGDRELRGRYSMPYSTSDEDMVDFIIKYKVNRISIWRTNDEKCKFEGTVYLKIQSVLVGFENLNEWETARIHDLPSWVEDDLKNEVINELNIFPNLCVDVDYEKKTPK